jgi:SLT domain-containing protein
VEKYCRAGQATGGGVYEVIWKNIVERGRPEMVAFMR